MKAFQLTVACLALCSVFARGAMGAATKPEEQFFDGHFHLTNYIQEGPDIREYLAVMGDRVGRSTVFGLPLQQQWSYRLSGKAAPTYYLESDAPLYYYSFTDAMIADEVLSLAPKERARFDPMITGFNPTDMYAAEHIRRVLLMYPGVFSGIGEFTIHKEFVSAKVAGEAASLTDPAVDRIFDFAGEVGLITLIHNDIHTPFPKEGTPDYYYTQAVELFRRHPKTTIIWAHLGLGRVIGPPENLVGLVTRILDDPELKHVYFDISWDELAKYLNATPDSARRTAEVLNRYPERFLFGTDNVGSRDPKKHFKIYEDYAALWKRLTPEASLLIRKGNYERLFDAARKNVRAWERAHVKAR